VFYVYAVYTKPLSAHVQYSRSCQTLCYNSSLEVEVEVNLRPTVSRPVCLGFRRLSGTRNQFFFLLEISFRQLQLCYFVAPSLTRGRVCKGSGSGLHYDFITSRWGPYRKHLQLLLCYKHGLLPSISHCTVICLVVVQQWLMYHNLFSGCCLAPGVYVTIY
jgi:hypothetical protein